MLVDRERRPHPPSLRHVADTLGGDDVRGQPEDLLARELDAPRGAHEPGHRVAQGRLPHAVAADHGEDAAVERERHALQRVRAAVVDVEVLDLEDQCRPLPHVDRLHLDVALDLRRAAVLEHPRVVHDGHVVHHAQRDVEVVLDEHEAHVRRQAAEQRHQLRALGGREPGGRLVEQDQARRAGEGHADLELALLAVREGRHGLPGHIGEPDALEQRLRRLAPRRSEDAVAVARDAAHREEQVVPHREVAEQERGLVGAAQPHADALVRRQRGHVLAEEQHATARGREVAGDHVEQGGFAGAVGPDHGAPLPHRDRERDVLDRVQGAEGPGDALQHEGVSGADGRDH